MEVSLAAMIWVPAGMVAAVLAASLVGRWVAIPVVVFEIVIGLLLGPSILGWVHESQFISVLADFGLVMLFFLAGQEIDFAAIRGRPLRRAALGWVLSLVVGLLLCVAVTPSAVAGVYLGVALSSTALGAIMPVLRDAGELTTPFGRAVSAVGAAGEFGPLLAISLFLSGRRPGTATALLLAFAVVAGLAIVVAGRWSHASVHRLIDRTMHSSGQFAVRLVVLMMAALAGLSIWLGIDMLLGAFAAGVVYQVLASHAEVESRELVESKLEGIGFGFLVPIFFVNTGLTFDLDALTDDTRALLLLPVFVVLLLAVRGLPSTLAAPPGSSARDRRALALFGATALPIIVAVTAIGVDHGDLRSSTAASAVGAGMISVLLFPLLGLSQRRRDDLAVARPGAPMPDALG
jgi:Kef-type K+ transport system membrane component KefB